jgi:cytochrome P450
MQTLLASKLPEPEKSTDRLFCESQVLLSAGTDTTASTLAKLTYHLLEKPEMLKRLKKELEMAIPEAAAIPLISQVENLPYLVSDFVSFFPRFYSRSR